MDDELQRFERAVDRLSKAFSETPHSGNHSTITLSAGGVGVWAAVTACLAMLAVNIVLVSILVSHDRKIDDLGHYLHAIYAAAPHLKPKEQ